HQAGEAFVADLTMRWLQDPTTNMAIESTPEDEGPGLLKSLEFQCSNVSNIEYMSSGIFTEFAKALSLLEEAFGTSHTPENNAPLSGRSQALRVLNAVPKVGEKRSRQLV